MATTNVPELETYPWAYEGEEPDSPVEAGYEPLKEPKAQHDNDYNSKIYNDLRNHQEALESLRDRIGVAEGDIDQLESDLQQQIDRFQQHNHDSRYPRQYQVYYRDEADDTFSKIGHDHDDWYWRKNEAEDRYLNSGPEGDTGQGRISVPELEVRVGEGFEIVEDSGYWGGSSSQDARVFRARDDNSDGGFLFEFTDNNGENRQELLSLREPGSDDSITHGHNKVWHAGNDGHGSGLDADRLDGTQLQTLYNELINADGDMMTGLLRFDGVHGDIMRIGDSEGNNDGLNVIRYDDVPLGFYAGGGRGHTFELGHDRVITKELLDVQSDIFMNSGIVKNTNRVDSVNGAISFLEYDGNTRITPGGSSGDATTLSDGRGNNVNRDIITVPNVGPVEINAPLHLEGAEAGYVRLPYSEGFNSNNIPNRGLIVSSTRTGADELRYKAKDGNMYHVQLVRD